MIITEKGPGYQRWCKYDDAEKKMYTGVQFDASKAADVNKFIRNSKNSFEQFKPGPAGLVPAASVPLPFIEMMMNGQCCTDGKRYNVFSPDLDERRRAYLHIQSEHKEWMLVDKTIFAKKRVV